MSSFLTHRLATPQLPKPLTAHLAKVFGSRFSHSEIERLFQAHGATRDAPVGTNKVDKCLQWLDHSALDPDCDALVLLGGLLSEILDNDPEPGPSLTGFYDDEIVERRKAENEKVLALVARYGLHYSPGGTLTRGATTASPTRTLSTILRAGDLAQVDVEFKRAIDSIERDPGAAVTAASSILEALFKAYIEDEQLVMPTKETVVPLWHVVRGHLGLDPATKEDVDIRTLLGSLGALVDGIGSFRTHAGSAHGRGRKAYKVDARLARLAVHSAHTLTLFVIETWQLRKSARNP